MFVTLELFPNITFFFLSIFIHFGIYKSIEKVWKFKPQINPTVLFITQVILFVTFYSFSFQFITLFYTSEKGSIGWGITVFGIIWIYIFLSFISSLLVTFLNKRKGFIILVFSALIFSTTPILFVNYRPYRVGLILLCGFVGLFLPYFLQAHIINEEKS